MRAFDASVPATARIYDFLLGGRVHFAADREIAARLLEIAPDAQLAVRDNRRFLASAVTFLAAEAGITQFLDIGSGFPGRGNVHEVAGRHCARPHVVYADHDPVVVGHAQTLLANHHPLVNAVLGDLRDPEGITGHHAVQELIDFARPVAVTLGAVLHFLDAPAAYKAVEYLKDLLVPGSYIAISHATADGARDGEADKIGGLYEDVSIPLYLRRRDEVEEFFEEMELVPPGVVEAGRWRGETNAKRVACWVGIGRRRR
jgi:O-methyltransferase involved in polyketide biosynthesis